MWSFMSPCLAIKKVYFISSELGKFIPHFLIKPVVRKTTLCIKPSNKVLFGIHQFEIQSKSNLNWVWFSFALFLEKKCCVQQIHILENIESSLENWISRKYFNCIYFFINIHVQILAFIKENLAKLVVAIKLVRLFRLPFIIKIKTYIKIF